MLSRRLQTLQTHVHLFLLLSNQSGFLRCETWSLCPDDCWVRSVSTAPLFPRPHLSVLTGWCWRPGCFLWSACQCQRQGFCWAWGESILYFWTFRRSRVAFRLLHMYPHPGSTDCLGTAWQPVDQGASSGCYPNHLRQRHLRQRHSMAVATLAHCTGSTYCHCHIKCHIMSNIVISNAQVQVTHLVSSVKSVLTLSKWVSQ